jgi:hypothetical protein
MTVGAIYQLCIHRQLTKLLSCDKCQKAILQQVVALQRVRHLGQHAPLLAAAAQLVRPAPAEFVEQVRVAVHDVSSVHIMRRMSKMRLYHHRCRPRLRIFSFALGIFLES